MFSRPLIEIQNQILGQRVEVAGTPFSLEYRSDRVPGRRAAYRVKISLNGGRVPAGVRAVVLEVEVAGQRLRERFAPEVPRYTYTWDGRDGRGQAVRGRYPARIRLGYEYRAAAPRPAVTRWQEWEQAVGAWDARSLGLGGWSLSVHHVYDRLARVLYLGNGRRRSEVEEESGPGQGEVVLREVEGALVFDAAGRHLRTVDGLTGGVVYRFSYDPDGRLEMVEDGDGNRTRVERDAAGAPVAIVGPWGTRTVLETEENGYLAEITNPRGEAVRCVYAAGGLLTEVTAPRGEIYRIRYDEEGRVVQVSDPVGGGVSLARKEAGTRRLVVRTTAGGQESTFQVERLRDGGQRETQRCCGGGEVEIEAERGGRRRIRYPDGTVYEEATEGAGRGTAGRNYLARVTATLPGGKQGTVTVVRAVEGTGEPLGVRGLMETIEVDGARYTRRYGWQERVLVERSPEGRERRVQLDEQGRVVARAVGGLEAVRYVYDGHGRVTEIHHGGRVVRVAYDEGRRMVSVTGPGGGTTRQEYDQAGRLRRQREADGGLVEYAYDANGNLIAVQPPGREAHRFEYGPLNLPAAYSPPAVDGVQAPTRYAYTVDHQLASITRPDGQTVALTYHPAGSVRTVVMPGGDIRFDYEPEAARLTRVATSAGEQLHLTYDGPLWTQLRWEGTLSGSVERTFNASFRTASLSVNGHDAIEEHHDRDGLVVQAGRLQLRRDAGHGLVRETQVARIRTVHEYTGYGELRAMRVRHDEREVYAVEYERDALGRILGQVERSGGQSRRREYRYDAAGRLVVVEAEGGGRSEFEYDSNGNRVKAHGAKGEQRGEYDAQDRMVRYGGESYRHAAGGEWASRTGPQGATTYEYDALGNLRAVHLGDGTRIEYVIDGANRRVGKRVNGRLVRGWLYQDGLKPIVELDGTGEVVSRFVYATRVNVPEYMERGGRVYRIVTDQVGSPRLVVDAETGDLVQQMTYDAWGQVLEDTRPGFQPFGFAGGLYDPHTGLVRFGARDYDPATGRWTAKDPIRFAGSGTNLYVYAGNDPVNWADPRGLQDEGAGIAVSDTSGGITVYITETRRPQWIPRIDDPLDLNGPPVSNGDNRSPADPGRIPIDRGPIRFNVPGPGGSWLRCAVGSQRRDVFDQRDVAPGLGRDPWTGHTGPQNPSRPTEADGVGGGVRLDIQF